MTRVLIVDDQPSFRRQLTLLLSLAGFIVVGEAGDIPTAESLVTNLRPDLAVVDVMLPGVNGIDGIPRLKAIAPSLRIFLVSAFQDQASVIKTSAQAAGAEAFIPKDHLDLDVVRAWKEGV